MSASSQESAAKTVSDKSESQGVGNSLSAKSLQDGSSSEATPRLVSRDLTDPKYRSAVLELLGMLAHGELQSFGRLAGDAWKAPDIDDRIQIGRLAVQEFEHMELLNARMVELGGEPIAQMRPFLDVFSEFDRRTVPGDWWEQLVKAYVGYGIATDLYREIARLLDPSTRALVEITLANQEHSDYVVGALKTATENDERLSSRLSLWGRRLVGEAVALAQSGLASHPGLLYLLEAGIDDGETVNLALILNGLMGEHTHRMERLGLTA